MINNLSGSLNGDATMNASDAVSVAGSVDLKKLFEEERMIDLDLLSADTYISLMSQYLPYHKASAYPEISRRLKAGEYEEAKKILERYNLLNGWVRSHTAVSVLPE